jgi:hypothetical protein
VLGTGKEPNTKRTRWRLTQKIAATAREILEHRHSMSNQGTATKSARKEIKIVHWIWFRHCTEHLAGAVITHPRRKWH